MCGPVITVWTVKYVWTSDNSVDCQVCRSSNYIGVFMDYEHIRSRAK